jgi:hypothetical protein
MTGTIFVDVAQLHDTCAAVRVDVEQGLRPGLTDTDRKVQQGVRFGQTSPSGEADAARRALLATLRRHRENGERHLSTADRLIAAMDLALKNYANADGSAALDLTEIEATLDTALPQQVIPRGLVL